MPGSPTKPIVCISSGTKWQVLSASECILMAHLRRTNSVNMGPILGS